MARPKYVPGGSYRFEVKRNLGRRDIIQYVAARLSLPDTWAMRLVRAGCVRVDGCGLEGPTANLETGRIVEVNFPKVWPPHMQPSEMDLSILYEDGHILVLDKPPGIVVHPARGHMDGATLQNGVLHRYAENGGYESGSIGPSHRLDMDTSGVIVYALTSDAHRNMVEQFTDRTTVKKYLAVVSGAPDFASREVAAPLGINPENRSLTAVVPESEGGKPALTGLKVLASGGGWGMVEARPFTGRPHQIRVHLAFIGHPVIGDRDYNPEYESHSIGRQALHAASLEFSHPITGERMKISAPLPDDIEELLRVLKGEENSAAR